MPARNTAARRSARTVRNGAALDRRTPGPPGRWCGIRVLGADAGTERGRTADGAAEGEGPYGSGDHAVPDVRLPSPSRTSTNGRSGDGPDSDRPPPRSRPFRLPATTPWPDETCGHRVLAERVTRDVTPPRDTDALPYTAASHRTRIAETLPMTRTSRRARRGIREAAGPWPGCRMPSPLRRTGQRLTDGPSKPDRRTPRRRDRLNRTRPLAPNSPTSPHPPSRSTPSTRLPPSKDCAPYLLRAAARERS